MSRDETKNGQLERFSVTHFDPAMRVTVFKKKKCHFSVRIDAVIDGLKIVHFFFTTSCFGVKCRTVRTVETFIGFIGSIKWTFVSMNAGLIEKFNWKILFRIDAQAILQIYTTNTAETRDKIHETQFWPFHNNEEHATQTHHSDGKMNLLRKSTRLRSCRQRQT